MENLNLSSWFDTQSNLLSEMNSDPYANNDNKNYDFDFAEPSHETNPTAGLGDFFIDNVQTSGKTNNYNNNNNDVINPGDTLNWDTLFSDTNALPNDLLWNENNMIDLDKQQFNNDQMSNSNKQLKLEEALRKQEELNHKLEAQLARSQMENQILSSKQSNTKQKVSQPLRAMLGDITSSSRLNSTPSRKLKASTKQRGGSNMKNSENFNILGKSIKPTFQQPIFLENTSSSTTSMNGSPRRRHNRSRSSVARDREHNMRVNFSTTLAQQNSISNNELKFESPSKSVVSPESPYRADSLSNKDLQSPVIGLGIRINDSRRGSMAAPENFKFRDSSNETSKSPSTSPIRPIAKFSIGETPNRRRKSVADVLLFNDNNMSSTPNLGPPQLKSSPLMSIADSPIIDHPDSRFTLSQRTSPELKPHGDDLEFQSPGFGMTPSSTDINSSMMPSPQKITRKLTTLPRGSIDIYVKELLDKKFECMYPDCGKTFKRRYNIRSHIQTHLEDRPYVCDFDGCDKAFVRNHDLVRHKKSHMEKRYACPCGKKFNREDALIVHRSRLICIGGKKFENVVIKRSPRKRGRPRKDAPPIESMSPTKKPVCEKHITKNSIPNELLNQPNLTPIGTFDIEDAVTNDSFLNELENELRLTLENEGQLS
ncbi:similar to Saccharomyces cerevisiae YDR146C SWI5 Transcription factor that activates transcription of genes expressed at the M/G1 phase boundary and in G1 phase [Maudiozyma barnettii]|uniref:Similar to Saccharomyces cerevisiae YDR146C SWI5 Transcription factor that activates transcription of genes expressed at the M/G1 phase boundary and in G1 phase n=1 Tax=Maudiozyma barnettii TaxID=61262 RepID=A0A8H2ZL07_9SACH|nr:DNA-binding transcription factor SWI5 [Kazachstania barnettii]CAB4255682.1 similar to Saccharomyces cerevisiae YDR146C SWI5 Transcription factor that activates transcription of genes expressed at the M/G1 phase boundary and in G1 phase [Kazachstania barnettii]CAD1784243.1 similar to Saccharomyces cerevisiae YDR146C SWI5 Transcription factor that activates transcription of genes expressed at the M/G1 phase boundary and in G1 phase [Kazachstania barnettii]